MFLNCLKDTAPVRYRIDSCVVAGNLPYEVPISPEKEAFLQQLATRTGKNIAQMVQEGSSRLLDYDAWFIAQVEEGLAAAARGELLEHEEVVERIKKRLRNKQRSPQ